MFVDCPQVAAPGGPGQDGGSAASLARDRGQDGENVSPVTKTPLCQVRWLWKGKKLMKIS